MAEEIKQEAVKSAPEANVEGLIADAIKAERERVEAEATAKKADDERIEARAKELADEYVKNVSISGYADVAIRTNGITKDSFPEAFKYFIVTKGNTDALKGMDGVDTYQSECNLSLEAVKKWRAEKDLPAFGSGAYKSAVKASNATDMNVGTGADGGSTVATGFFNEIITKRDESALHIPLGLTKIAGVGTTVDVSFDNEADGEFISTNEASQFDEDAPAVSKVSMTLVKYTKRTLISDELKADTAVDIMQFVRDRVAIGWAKTINNLIVTEAVTGTQYVRGGTTTGFADGEMEDVIYNSTLAPYANGFDLAWVTRSPTYGILRKLSANARVYGSPHSGPTDAGVGGNRTLLEYPVYFSQKVDAVAARAKSILFGAWSYMLYREGAGLEFLFDPFTRADFGQDRLLWKMRWDTEIAIADAIGYFEHDLT